MRNIPTKQLHRKNKKREKLILLNFYYCQASDRCVKIVTQKVSLQNNSLGQNTSTTHYIQLFFYFFVNDFKAIIRVSIIIHFFDHLRYISCYNFINKTIFTAIT